MKALFTSVVAGLGLLALLSSGSAQTADHGQNASRMKGGCILPEPKGQGFVGIEIRGKIRKTSSPLVGGEHWEITADGRTYVLDLGPSKIQHHLMDGQTILVRGRLQHRVEQLPTCGPEYPGKPRPQPVWWHSWVVVADTLQHITDGQHNFVNIEFRGTLRMTAKVGYPPQTLSIVAADGQTVVLDFGNKVKRKALAQKLDGKQVVVRGSLSGWHTVPYMCMPSPFGPDELPMVSVDELAEVKEQECKTLRQFSGKLTWSKKPADPKWEDDYLPRWQLTVGDKTYALEFDSHADLAQLAKKLEGNTVEVAGFVETREYVLGMRPDPKGGPVLLIARVVTMEVLAVKSLRGK